MNVNRIESRSVDESVQDAVHRPLDFNPAQRASFIREMLRSVPAAIQQGKTDEQIRVQFKEFADYYPELLKKILEHSDLAPIHTMLAMMDKISTGSLNTHQASVIVGQRLADRFVTPRLSEPAADTRER